MDVDDCFSPSSYGSTPPDLSYITPSTTPATSPIKRNDTPCAGPLLDGVVEQADLEIEEVRRSLPSKKSPASSKRSSKLRPPNTLSSVHRHAINKTISSPDRFVLSRTRTPTKERLLLAQPDATSRNMDPFSPQARRTLQANQFFTVVRYPPPITQRYGQASTSVTRASSESQNVSQRWTVAGLPVTEGVASTSNGRGGRITSGTNAPLYNASMMVESERVQEAATFKRRLAQAMDIDLNTKMLPAGQENKQSLDTTPTGRGTVWKDCQWQASHATNGTAATSKALKKVSTVPFKVLDAPELRNDYYCSLLAYCHALKCIAVGLGNHIYVWCDSKTAKPDGIRDSIVFPKGYGHITSIDFSSQAGGKSILAIGRSDGKIALWSPLDARPRLRCDQIRPVSHVSFRPCPSKRQSLRDANITVMTEELLVGTEDGSVLLYSIEWPSQDQCDLFDWTRSMQLRTIVSCHSQQICGVAWSSLGESFATGGNDNYLLVFDWNKIQQPSQLIDGSTRAPHHAALKHHLVLPEHEKQRFKLNAAVKAIAFAPWQASLLAARGGSNDRCVHFLHTTSGARLATINCHAQVTSLTWHSTRKELAATLGFPQPNHPVRIVTFAWPSCEQLTSIAWVGEERALYGISYPRSESGKKEDALVVATSDHSIKFHDIWHEGRKGGKDAARYAKSQILNDICSESLERELEIR